MFTTLSRNLVMIALAMAISGTIACAQDGPRGLGLLLNGSSNNLTLTAGSTLNIQAGSGFPQSGTIFLVVSLATPDGTLDPRTAFILAARDMPALEGIELDVKVPALPHDIRVAVQAFVVADNGRVHASNVSHVKVPAMQSGTGG